MEYKKIDRDYSKMDEDITDSVAKELTNLDISGLKGQVKFKNIKQKVSNHSYDDIKSAIVDNKTLLNKITGDIELVGRDGKVIDSRKNATLLSVPAMTKKGTFLINGTSYIIPNQIRSRYGIFSVKKPNGVVESSARLSKGKPMKVFFDDKTDKMKLSVSGKTLNPESILKYTEGGDAPSERERADALKFLSSVGKIDPSSHPENSEIKDLINEYFADTRLDSKVMKATFGEDRDYMKPSDIRTMVNKVNGIRSGKLKPDDRENLMFKKIITPDKLIAENIAKGFKKELFKTKGKLNTFKDIKLKDIYDPGKMSKIGKNFISSAAISRFPEEYNPLQIKSLHHDLTPLGEGGISDSGIITSEQKAVHPSQMGIIDPIKSPEGASTGITLGLTQNAYVGEDGTPAAKVWNIKKKKYEVVPVDVLNKSKVGFPIGEKDKADGTVGIRHGNEIKEGKAGQLDYLITKSKHLFGPGMNATGMINSSDSGRGIMASKHVLQAVPIEGRETRGFQLKGDGDNSMHSELAKFHLPVADASGTITKIDDKAGTIYIKSKDGNIHKKSYIKDYLPLNTKTFLSHNLKVNVGDNVKKGDHLADSNFTKDGSLALGTHLKTAWMMYPGTRNDAVVISESAAKKLTSMHSLKHDIGKNYTEQNLSKFKSIFPEIAKHVDLKNYDEKGIAKKGVVLKTGDPISLGLKKMDASDLEINSSKVNKLLFGGYTPEVHKWKYDDNAEVKEIRPQKDGSYKVITHHRSKAVIGDKLAGLYGNKGIVSKVLPDNEMPSYKDGKDKKNVELILGGASVVSRVNPGQIVDSGLNTISKKTGKQYIIDHFENKNNAQFLKDEAKKHNVKFYHDVYDPNYKKNLGKKVFIADHYTIKGFKNADSGWSAVGIGAIGLDGKPVKGGRDSASSIGNMELNSLLSAGAKDFLREARSIRSQKNDQWINNYLAGLPTPPVKDSSARDKFKSMMHQLNVNVKEDGKSISTLPISSKAVKKMSSGEVKSGETVYSKNGKPVKKGLYDGKIFGGNGDRYGHISLNGNYLNPMYTDVIQNSLGMTSGEFNHSIKSGDIQSIVSKIKKLDIDKKIQELQKNISSGKNKASLNKDVKTLNTLKKIKKNGMKMSDAVVLTDIPVIPPQHRQLVKMPDGKYVSHDLNMHYKDIITTKNTIKEVGKGVKPETVNSLKGLMQEQIGAMYGVNESPSKKLREAGVKGVIDYMASNRPKTSFWQKNMLKNNVFTSGRAIISPSSHHLKMDEVEIPKDMAFKMYSPHIERGLGKLGIRGTDAKEHIKDKTELAKNVLNNVMKTTPVVINRAPSLHSYSMVGAMPKLTDEKVIRIPSMWEDPLGGDFDGDQVGIHVPLTQKAADDVKRKLLPSKRLHSLKKKENLVFGLEIDPYIGMYETTKK